jgi:hypothetical protein
VSGRHSRTRARARPKSGRPPSRTRPSRSWPAQAAGRDGTIFRGEALESRARDLRAPEVEIHLGTAWIRWLYRLALGLVAAGIVVVMTARTAQCDYGTAVITEPGDQFAALLPVAVLPDLARSRNLDVVLELPRSRQVRVTWVRVRLAGPNLVRRAGLAPPTQPSLLLTGRLTAGIAAEVSGAARHSTAAEVSGAARHSTAAEVSGAARDGASAWAGRAAREITPMTLIVGSEPVAALLASEFQVMLGIRRAGS